MEGLLFEDRPKFTAYSTRFFKSFEPKVMHTDENWLRLALV